MASWISEPGDPIIGSWVVLYRRVPNQSLYRALHPPKGLFKRSPWSPRTQGYNPSLQPEPLDRIAVTEFSVNCHNVDRW